MKLKFVKLNAFLFLILFVLFSCSKDPEIIIETVEVVKEVEVTVTETVTVELDPFADSTLEGVLTSDKTLSSDKIWLIKGRVVVGDGATLTIPAGTVIKAEPGSGADASTLIIARGGKIDAKGTASKPIIMTAKADNIQADGTYPATGASLTVNSRGLWGGLLVLGKAPSSFKGDVNELQIEGIPVSDTNGLYGGSVSDDNSGTMQYISIRHGGAEIGEGNEINGLTLGGVGSGTVIEHIEVIANVDDGIEFFGGTVNASYLLVWGQGDDALDIDQAYSGIIDDAYVILEDASDHGMEIDGPEGSAAGSFTIKNVTIDGASKNGKALGVDGEIADFRKAATGSLSNIYAFDFVKGKDVELDADADSQSYTAGTLTFANWDIQFAVGAEGSISDVFVDKSSIGSTFTTDAASFAEIVTAKKDDAGATNSEYTWTRWYAVNN